MGDQSQKLVRGPLRLINQFRALVKKRFFYHLGHPFSTLLQVILPLFLAYHQTHAAPDMVSEELKLSMDVYSAVPTRECLIEMEQGQPLENLYKGLLGSQCDMISTGDINRYVFEMDPFQNYEALRTIMVGIKIANDSIFAVFNNEPLHSIPISLTAVYNSLIAERNDPNVPQLLFTSKPLPKEAAFSSPSGWLVVYGPMFLAFWTALYGLVYIQERVTGAMNLQFLSGLSPVFYWIVSLLHDMVLVTSAAALCVLLSVLVSSSWDGVLETIGDCMMATMSTLPLVYLIARMLRGPAALISWVLLLGILAVSIYILFMTQILKFESEVFFMVLPYLNLASCMMHKYVVKDYEEVMWKNKAMFLGSGLLWFTLLIMIDRHMFAWLGNWGRVQDKPLGQLDDDVQGEMLRVDMMTQEQISTKPLVAKHLRKAYKANVAVRDATFVLEG